MELLFHSGSRCRHCMCPLSQRQYISHIKLVHHAFGYDTETEDGSYTFTNWTDYWNEEGDIHKNLNLHNHSACLTLSVFRFIY